MIKSGDALEKAAILGCALISLGGVCIGAVLAFLVSALWIMYGLQLVAG